MSVLIDPSAVTKTDLKIKKRLPLVILITGGINYETRILSPQYTTRWEHLPKIKC